MAIQVFYSSIVLLFFSPPPISVDGGERGVQVTRAFELPFPLMVSDVFIADFNKRLLPASAGWAKSDGKLPDVTPIVISVARARVISLRPTVFEGPKGGGEFGTGLLDGVEGGLC